MHGSYAPKGHTLEIKQVLLKFAQILTQQYSAYFPDTLFGARVTLSIQVGLQRDSKMG